MNVPFLLPRSLRLALEPRQPLWVAQELLRQQLQRDLAAEARIARAIDLAHAAGTQQFKNLEAAKPRSCCGHWFSAEWRG